jgi:hypothetical protein
VDETAANQGHDDAKQQKQDIVPQYQKNIEEILSSIPLAAAVAGGENPLTRKTWIAIKLVGYFNFYHEYHSDSLL